MMEAVQVRERDLRRLISLICEQPFSYQRNLNENILRDGRRVWIAWTKWQLSSRQSVRWSAVKIA